MYGVIIENGPQNWQILQQTDGFADVRLSGSLLVEDELLCEPDACVTVRVLSENSGTRITEPVSVKPTNGKWKAEIRIPAGGLYRIETYFRYKQYYEKRGDRIFHIGVGDVYCITGQSNAVGVGKDTIPDPISLDVHLYRMNGRWDMASHPLNDSTDTVFPILQETGQTGHSPWLSFAKSLAGKLGYPIGLIPTAKGGVPLSDWDRNEDGKFFDNMLSMIERSGCGGIKGIVWYQGCNDAVPGLAETYYERFCRVYSDFQKTFDGVPVLTVQLNKVTCIKGKEENGLAENWCAVREAQRKAKNQLENVWMTPSIDCMVCDGIHNSSFSNVVLGERVTNLALKYVYCKTVVCDAPDIAAAFAKENQVRLVFRNVFGALFSDLNRTEDLMFSLYDDDGKIVPEDYECNGNEILLVFGRKIAANATVSCDRINVTGLMPYDTYTYLPIIPFGGIAVEKES